MKLLMLLLSTVFSASLVKAEPTAYSFYCRGPLKIVYYANLFTLGVTVEQSDRAAGPKGSQLQPGSCAWEDRPLNASEPRELLIASIESSSNPIDQAKFSAGFQAISQIVTTALAGSNSVVAVKAYTQNGFLNRAKLSGVMLLPVAK